MNKKKIISYAIDVILVAIILFLGYVQISMLISKNDKSNYGVPRVFGKSFLYVATESMNNPKDPNCLKAGTGIIIEKVKDFNSLRVSNPLYEDKDDPEKITNYDLSGDIVTFYLDSVGVPDTHRLIYKNYDEETHVWTFKTMGDAPEAHTRGRGGRRLRIQDERHRSRRGAFRALRGHRPEAGDQGRDGQRT